MRQATRNQHVSILPAEPSLPGEKGDTPCLLTDTGVRGGCDGPTLELIHAASVCDGITFTAKLDRVQQKLEGTLQKKWASRPESLPRAPPHTSELCKLHLKLVLITALRTG